LWKEEFKMAKPHPKGENNKKTGYKAGLV